VSGTVRWSEADVPDIEGAVDLMFERRTYGRCWAYIQSKLANLLFTRS
jgi:hypothetical protein